MRPTKHDYFRQMAELVSTRSTCFRRSVGCVLVDARDRVLATGYNGVVMGAKHCNTVDEDHSRAPLRWPYRCSAARSPSGTNLEGCDAVHAEQNAIVQCRDTQAIAAAYVTTFPCSSCTKLLLNTSCQAIYYAENYPGDGQLLWAKSGRIAVDLSSEEPHMFQRDIARVFDQDATDRIAWRIAIGCTLTNLASARQARPVMFRLFDAYWDPPSLVAAKDELIRPMVEPLGLVDRRLKALRAISEGFKDGLPLREIPYIGPYALESIAAFVHGDLSGPFSDRKVEAWALWARIHFKT
jgi:dCMP deaminase